jgi:hypothetical protein
MFSLVPRTFQAHATLKGGLSTHPATTGFYEVTLSDADDLPNGIAPSATETAADAPEAMPASTLPPHPSIAEQARQARHARAVAHSKAVARKSPRNSSGQFMRRHPPKPPSPRTEKRVRSKVTNGRALFLDAKSQSPEARRFADILSQIIADLGGHDAPLSEAQKQIARRAASLSISCERLEQIILAGTTSAAEQAFMSASGGLSPYVVLREASKAPHGIARVRGGDTITAIAKLPEDQLDRVTDLLCKAGDLAAKCINVGSARSADLELLGALSDRCGRAFARLGLARIPREVNGGHIGAMAYARADQSEVWSPLREAMAKAAKDAQAKDAQPVDADALEPIDVTSGEAADG